MQLPKFSLRCQPDPNDSAARIEIVAFPAGRVLGNTVLRVMGYPQKTPVNTYQRPVYNFPSADKVPQTPRENLETLINHIRAQAKLQPLRLEKTQSEIADQVTPHYFASLGGSTSETIADKIVLGLRAGWKVKGMVRQGYFTSAFTTQPENLTYLLSNAMEQPYGRFVLVHPDVHRIAIGTFQSQDPSALGVLLNTYSLFEQKNDFAQEQQRILDQLTQARAAQNRKAPFVLESVQNLAKDTAQNINAGKLQPKEGLQQLLSRASQHLQGGNLGGSLGGWALQTSDLNDIDFPEELLQAHDLQVSIGVTHFLPQDEPWGTYVILFVVHVPETI